MSRVTRPKSWRSVRRLPCANGLSLRNLRVNVSLHISQRFFLYKKAQLTTAQTSLGRRSAQRLLRNAPAVLQRHRYGRAVAAECLFHHSLKIFPFRAKSRAFNCELCCFLYLRPLRWLQTVLELKSLLRRQSSFFEFAYPRQRLRVLRVAEDSSAVCKGIKSVSQRYFRPSSCAAGCLGGGQRGQTLLIVNGQFYSVLQTLS